ncbi:MAG: hypothetical protein CVV42_00755 [Candidatus Riflebacteria bacterium HGW-Riflebacteria-2]|jgi:hypothetical protein|nr:MAG: hypothetical protein CVV42_00755 [Candidatus Riflebacteria bacterium HGW-Riflebacteria-2]
MPKIQILRSFTALRKYLLPVLILTIALMAGCRGCRERDNSFPQAGEVPAAPLVTGTYPEGGDIDIPLNSKISATFNMPMAASEIGTATFSLTRTGGAAVDGTVTYVGLIALFDPTVDLVANTSYSATVNAGIRSVAGNTLAENFTWTFTTGATIDIIRPTVVSTNPVSGAVGVPVNTIVAVPFSEVMDPATINSNTFFLTEAPAASIRAQGSFLPSSVPGGLVSGTVSYLGKTAYFKPESPLKLGTTYTAVINTGAKDVAGNTLAENYVWSFTGVVADTTAPTVISTDPAANLTGVAINTKIAVTFSEMMSIDTITNSTFMVEGLSGTVVYDPLTKIATFKPTTTLTANKLYSATIITAAQDLAGNAIASNYIWTFTTGATVDTTAPTVLATVPAAAATNVSASQQITCTFSEGMESATINGTTFTLTGPGGAVAGTVTYAGTTATFIPTGGLANSTIYSAAVTTGVKDLAGNAMAAIKTWSFTTGAAATTVTSTDPLNGASNVATNKSISATFSGTMDPTTINGTTFTLQGPGGAAIAGAVSYVGTTATFKPSTVLANSTIYTATITTGAKDLAGKAIAAAKTWSFTTGAAPDIIAPTVTSTSPAEGDINVPTNKSITAVFSESMDFATITDTTFTLTAPGGATVGGAVTCAGTTATFKPTVLLGNSGIYTATITTGAKDTAGNAMASVKTWTFTTGLATDSSAPSVTSVDPVDAATVVATNKIITANFSESMDSATITNTTFTVRKLGGALIDGAVTYAGTTATFKPASLLTNSTTYVANITVGVKDLAGNAMATAKTWSFVTGAAPDTVAPTVASTDPLNAATGVATNKSISAAFSESMDSATITTTNFTLRKLGGAFIIGTVTYDSTAKAATFKPTSLLANSTTYVANLTTAVEDLAGNALALDKTWSFTTGAAPDIVAPTVTSTSPADGETDVPTNKSVTALFSESMDSATISNTTFTLTGPSGALVSGMVSYVGTTATFKPAAELGNSKTYTARISTGAKDMAGNAIAAVKTWSFTTGALPDTIAPSVVSVDPADAATSVATNKIVTANFSENMDSATITNTTFTVRESGGALIAGAVTHTGTTAAFKPASLLKNSTTYVANITVGVKDLAGNAMATAKTWSFGTSAAPDIVAPTVTSTDPFNTAINVATNKSIIASFSESMNSATITTANFTVRKFGGALIDGTVTYDSTAKAATFKPTSPLANSTTYVANVTTAVEDLAGNELGVLKSWSFTTEAAPDTTAPQITSVYPVNGAKDIGCKEAITATFDEDMDSATIFQTTPKVTFTLTGPGLTPVAGVVTYANKIAKFTSDSDLADNTLFTATIDTQATDLAGNQLAATRVWTFTTGQSEPVLGRAGSFALMASTAISGVAGSVINGDVGVSPAGRASITLTATDINGTIYSATDQEIIDAIADLRIAYDTAKAKVTNVVDVTIKDLGGKTFYPGLYKTIDTFDITTGNLTLDAQGNANAIFIFQMPTTLTVATGRQVILSGNAKASNIYWQVGSSATLNTTSIFKGNILANISITVNGSSNVEGRLLAAAGTAGSGAVVFNESTITIPAP